MLEKTNYKKLNFIIFVLISLIFINYFELWFIFDSLLTQKVHCSDNHLSLEEMISKHEDSMKRSESKKFLIRVITVACCIVIMFYIHKDGFK